MASEAGDSKDLAYALTGIRVDEEAGPRAGEGGMSVEDMDEGEATEGG